MTSIQSKLRKIQDALLTVTESTYHYWRAKAEPPFLVWAEDGEIDSFHAGNRKQEQQLHGSADLYTKTEFDPLVDEIQDALDEIMTGWTLSSVQYEDETGLIHYTWDWWVT